MLRLAPASLYILLGACLDLSRAWTIPTAALRKHVNNPIVARTRTRTPIRPTPKKPWASGDGAAASEGGCRFERGVGGVRSVAPRLMSMATSATSTRSAKTTNLGGSRSVNWPLWYVLPIAPYQRRKTLVKEIVPGKVGFDLGLLMLCVLSTQVVDC